MYSGMPTLVPADSDSDAGSMQYDPVTGAPRLSRPGYTQSPSWSYYPTPAFLPPYGYNYSGYIGTPYLTASPQPAPVQLPPSPRLSPTLNPVPAGWVNAYYDYYPHGTPYRGPLKLSPESSPRQRQVPLHSSPQISPFANLVPLPAVDDEDYEDPHQTWASRLMNFITRESNDPHRELKRIDERCVR